MSNVLDNLGRIKVSLGSSNDGAWPIPGKVKIGVTEYSSIGAAITTASAGDTLYAVGAFTENVTLNKAVRLVGLGQGAFSITGTVAVSDAGAIFENCTVTGRVSVTAAATIINIIASEAGGTNSRGISVTGNNAILIDCRGTASGASTTNRGLYVAATGVKDFRGNYTATGTGNVDIYVDSGDVSCFDTVTTTLGTIVGTVYGLLQQRSNGFPYIPPSGQLLLTSGAGLYLLGSGGTSQYLKQTALNGVVSVGAIAAADLPAASESDQGAAYIDTQAEVNAGADDAGIVTALKLANAATVNKTGHKNLLYSSMCHNLWQEGLTLNDLADDTYGPDTVWNVLNKDNAPDISGQAGGASDPFTISFRCTFDSNTAQAGIVQFLEAEDTYPLRGQVVSLSADLWGTNVTSLRMAVLEWASTADVLTSDVVGTWATGNPTLATNWSYIGTPAAITITSTRTRYKVENLTVGSSTNNLAVFIWTDANESSGDLWNVARVQLEIGPVATAFVARPVAVELSLVRRYFLAIGGADAFEELGLSGQCVTTTTCQIPMLFPVAMRAGPTLTVSAASDWAVTNASGTATALSSISIASATTKTARVVPVVASGLVAGNATHLLANNTTNARAYFNARL